MINDTRDIKEPLSNAIIGFLKPEILEYYSVCKQNYSLLMHAFSVGVTAGGLAVWFLLQCWV